MLKLYDILLVSLRQVVRQRARSLGVIFTIALGTAGFIVIITMSRDVKQNLNRDLDLLGGATLIHVSFEEYYSGRDRFSQPQWFRENTLKALRRVPGVSAVSAMTPAISGSSSWRDRQHHFPLLGVDGSFWEVNSFSAVEGELFDSPAVDERRKICVLGSELAQKIFGQSKVVGSFLPIDNDVYQVTGVIEGIGVGDRIRYAFIPLTTAQDRVRGFKLPDRLLIRCSTWDDVETVAASIPTVVQGNQPAERLRLEVRREQLKRVRRIAWWVEVFMYFSVAATLVLGGFGIWNGMMTAVRSRTREIGLKKAMGAEDGDILTQFLGEAMCLSVGSALLGVGIGRALTEIIAHLLDSRPPEDIFIVCVGFGLLFSIFLGVGGGFYPSLRASRMEVSAAMRYE